MIYTTKKITLIILLKTNGCKRLKIRHLKIHRKRKYSYLVNLIKTCIHRAETYFFKFNLKKRNIINNNLFIQILV